MRSRTRVGTAVAAALIVAGLSARAAGRLGLAPTFDAMVARAQVVFVGETLDVRSQWVSTPSGPPSCRWSPSRWSARSRVSSAARRSWSSSAAPWASTAWRFRACPRFRVGDEDVLFVDERGQPVSPVVGFMHGRFRVLEDPGTRRRSVARHNFEPLASVRDIGAATPAPRVSAARALTLAAFEDEIAREVRRQREAR